MWRRTLSRRLSRASPPRKLGHEGASNAKATGEISARAAAAAAAGKWTAFLLQLATAGRHLGVRRCLNAGAANYVGFSDLTMRSRNSWRSRSAPAAMRQMTSVRRPPPSAMCVNSTSAIWHVMVALLAVHDSLT